MDNKISFGKRPKNPLNKRVWKDILRDWKRYLMIFLMLIVTIGFVSGMYVANNSMLYSMDKNVSEMKREDGHFTLSEIADNATVKAIETGEMADVLAVYRERAYNEAVVEIEKSLNEVFKNAKDSEEYKKALSDATEEAEKKINEDIDEKYTEIEERYELNKKFEPVPVSVFELLYKDTDEVLQSKINYSGTIRVYSERVDIDLYDILKGRAPEKENEIIIDRMHAENSKIKIGDILKVGNTDFEVVGLAAFSDYSALYENNSDIMFDALTFDVGMTTNEGFERIRANTIANYAFMYNVKPADEFEEKEMSEHFLKSLITQTAVSDIDNLEIKDYVPAYANQAMNFARDDIGKDKAMGGVLLYILTAVLAFIFAVTISTTLEQEASVIGTLRASGYTRCELLRYYMGAPLLIVIIASIIGNVLGYTVFKDIVAKMYYSSYSLPGFETIWTPEAFIRTTLVPIVLMLVINAFVITKTLKLSPLRFLRHDLKRNKRKKAMRLPKWKFLQRFRIRVFLQNIPNYIMLLIGISFVMLLISMAVGMPETLSYYQEKMCDMTFASEQIILSSTEDEYGNLISTETDGAERFSINSLERKSDSYNEEIPVYGIESGSRYVNISPTDYGSVYISKAFAEKYNVHPGETIILSEKYEHKDYRWTVYDIYDYSAGVAVFMENGQFNMEFNKKEGEFSGYMSDKKINDIDTKYIAKEITTQDMIKVADQLDHSMGAYMQYFQYVCFIVATIILYLLTKIIIEKNENSISMTKILGYENVEIASLYLIPTAIVVLFSEFIAIYIGYKLMQFFWKLIMMKMSGWFAFIMPLSGFVKEFILVFAAYLVITVFDFIRIRKIPKVLALKKME